MMPKKFFSFDVTGHLYEKYKGDEEAAKTPFTRKINVVAPSAECAEAVIRSDYSELNKNILNAEVGEIIESLTLVDEQPVSYVVTVS